MDIYDYAEAQREANAAWDEELDKATLIALRSPHTLKEIHNLYGLGDLIQFLIEAWVEEGKPGFENFKGKYNVDAPTPYEIYESLANLEEVNNNGADYSDESFKLAAAICEDNDRNGTHINIKMKENAMYTNLFEFVKDLVIENNLV